LAAPTGIVTYVVAENIYVRIPIANLRTWLLGLQTKGYPRIRMFEELFTQAASTLVFLVLLMLSLIMIAGALLSKSCKK
jgi:hypothetical protein